MSGSTNALTPWPPLTLGGTDGGEGRESPQRHSTPTAPMSRPACGPGIGVSEDWPLRSYLELGAMPSATPCARLHTREVLREWGLQDLNDSAELIVSELVTNALNASLKLNPTYPIRLWLLSDKTRIAILVWDGNPLPLIRADVDEKSESGRGLFLVEALSERWNWYPVQGGGGKVVWSVTPGIP